MLAIGNRLVLSASCPAYIWRNMVLPQTHCSCIDSFTIFPLFPCLRGNNGALVSKSAGMATVGALGKGCCSVVCRTPQKPGQRCTVKQRGDICCQWLTLATGGYTVNVFFQVQFHSHFFKFRFRILDYILMTFSIFLKLFYAMATLKKNSLTSANLESTKPWALSYVSKTHTRISFLVYIRKSTYISFLYYLSLFAVCLITSMPEIQELYILLQKNFQVWKKIS